MLSLAEIQAGFAAALSDPARPAPEGLRRPVGRRFAVHRNNMTVALIEALETAFPAVRRLVGDDFFRAAARVYLRREPPRSPVLLLYGETFGNFLDGFEPARGVPYLGDVARLEWARLSAYHAADAEPLTVARLAEVPQDRLGELRFALHPSLRLLTSRYPVAALWAAAGGGDSAREVDMTKGEEVAVVRPALAVELRVLPPGGYGFIAALAGGAALGEAAEAALAGDPGFDLAVHLQGLFALGGVAGLRLPETNQRAKA
ncbi:MAG: putative DNA-binding domain-containing protein [Kiloniellaceae bacterium]